MKENIELLDDEQVLKKELEELELKEKEIDEKLREKDKVREKKERLAEALLNIESKKTPADKGREAFLSGKGLKENPYTVSVSEDQANYEEWLEAWLECRFEKANNADTQSQPSESIVRRLESIEKSLKNSQPPEDEGFESLDKVMNRTITKITENAEGQIRRARRYMVAIGVAFVIVVLGVTLFANLTDFTKDSTLKSEVTQQVEEVKATE